MLYILVSCLLMTSCLSDRVVYKHSVPDITFPIFPALERTVNPDGSWTIPKESVDLLAEYYIQITATETTYKEIKELLENEK